MTKYYQYTFFIISVFIALNTLAQKPGSKAAGVFVAEVKRMTYVDELEALGTLRANENVEIASSVTEVVTSVKFTDSQRVKKGDILLEMDAIEEFAELAEQESFLSEALQQVKRLTPLAKKGAASEAVLDENRRNAAAARARINAAKSRIDQRIIRAPFDGVVGIRNISVGTLARPGSFITTIDDDSAMKLDFSVPELFLSSLHPGLKIKATTDAYRGRIFEGVISSVSSRIDPVTRSIGARAILENIELKSDQPSDEKLNNYQLLKSGLLMRVVLQKNPRQALVIPEEAVISNGPNNFVLAVSKSKGKSIAQQKKIELGTRRFGEVEVLAGLNEGEFVITHGIMKVKPGMAVEVKAIEQENDTLKTMLDRAKSESAITPVNMEPKS